MSSLKLITHLPLGLSILYKLESLLSPPLLTRDASLIDTESATVIPSYIYTPKLGLTKKGENVLFVFLNLGCLSIFLSSSIYLSVIFMVSNKEPWGSIAVTPGRGIVGHRCYETENGEIFFSGEGGRKAKQK